MLFLKEKVYFSTVAHICIRDAITEEVRNVLDGPDCISGFDVK